MAVIRLDRTVDPGGAGNIQVHEWVVADEGCQEGSCRDRSRWSSGQVLQVGDVALDHLVVLGPHRELPHPLTAGFTGAAELVSQRLVGSEQAGGV